MITKFENHSGCVVDLVFPGRNSSTAGTSAAHAAEPSYDDDDSD